MSQVLNEAVGCITSAFNKNVKVKRFLKFKVVKQKIKIV